MSDPYSFGGFDPNQTTEYDPTAMDDLYLDQTQDYPYPPAYPPSAFPPPAAPGGYNPMDDQPTIQQMPTQVPARVPKRASSRAQPLRAPDPATRAVPDRRDSMARASLWLGILSAAVSLIPVCGIVALFPAVFGIVFGWYGRKSRRRNMALAGILLSMLAIAAAVTVVL